MEQKHVFISYVRENEKEVHRLYDDLTKYGVKIWLDRRDIEPGVRWENTIRKAIREGVFFIACFSKEYNERRVTFMNEELTLAIDELRQRPTDRVWFIPVKLNKCEIPDWDIGPGKTLRDLQYIELYKDWDDGIKRILEVLAPARPFNEQEIPDFINIFKQYDVRFDDIDERLNQLSEVFQTQFQTLHEILEEANRKVNWNKDLTLCIPGEGYYELIKPLIGYKREIEEQIKRFPFHQNVFLMMKFRDSIWELGEFIIETLSRYDLRGVSADLDDWNITKNVYNPIAVLYCCKYGIALFDEPEEHQAYNANVAYELGMMHYQRKNCLILKHESLPNVPFDLIKDLYFSYERDLQVRRIIERWVKQVAAK